jgi:hypothetical protein
MQITFNYDLRDTSSFKNFFLFKRDCNCILISSSKNEFKKAKLVTSNLIRTLSFLSSKHNQKIWHLDVPTSSQRKKLHKGLEIVFIISRYIKFNISRCNRKYNSKIVRQTRSFHRCHISYLIGLQQGKF